VGEALLEFLVGLRSCRFGNRELVQDPGIEICAVGPRDAAVAVSI